MFVFILALIASIFFGLDGNIPKYLGVHVEDGVIAAALRAFGAIVFLLLLRRGSFPKLNASFLASACCSAMGSLLFVLAILRIPTGAALILFHAAILWIILAKWITRSAVSKLDIITGILVFVGLVIVCYQDNALKNPEGWILGILSGMSFAGYLYFTELHDRKYKNPAVYKDSFLFAQIIVVALGVIKIGASYPEMPKTPGSALLGLCIMGLFYGVGYTILGKAMHKGSSHLVGIYIGGMEPPIGILFGFLLLGDKIPPQVYAGFLLILTAISVRGIILYKKEKRQNIE